MTEDSELEKSYTYTTHIYKKELMPDYLFKKKYKKNSSNPMKHETIPLKIEDMVHHHVGPCT
jgi:hypothetical protein